MRQEDELALPQRVAIGIVEFFLEYPVLCMFGVFVLSIAMTFATSPGAGR